ncbi:MAG TPA: hypothetical protein DIW52_05660, partial [Pseudomonas sp.]|nr:hypothetical protein [Pseudomonas sp.]
MTNTAAHENDPAIQARAIRKAVQDNGLPSRFTSVGMTSIERFLRPVSYQGFPDALLPEALR